MDPSRDNPLFRLKAFWWAVGLFVLFTVALWIVGMANRKPALMLEDYAAAPRYQTRAKVEAAQQEKLAPKVIEQGKTVQVPPAAAFGVTGKRLLESKPAAVEKPEQLVAGSATSVQLAATAPATDYAAVDAMTDPNAAPGPAMMELGKTQYLICAACHGQNGDGGPVGPPHAGSEWVNGPVSNLIRIQFRGLQGPITVKGKEYNFPTPMAPLATQTDEQIAAVLTYVRNSFGNKAAPVTAAQVKALRGEVGKPALTVADLIPPTK